jgi:hypothetical protein
MQRPRFKQLTDWLGPDFDAVIVFDEAHLMKNAAGTKRGGGDWEITYRLAARMHVRHCSVSSAVPPGSTWSFR